MRIKITLLLLVCILFSGCSTTLRQSWYDFSAYYNTFYNATRYYQAGVLENRDLHPDINPEIPLRVHSKPTSGGTSNFTLAIENGAEILRTYSRSGYVDEAISLIGKSYYYLGENFSALEKFQELYTNTENMEMRHRAVIWEGRTYLEMGFYSEGIRVLQSRLVSSGVWEPDNLAEANVILAQLYVHQEEWQEAATLLEQSLDDISDVELEARGYFLYGQILEKLESYEDAFYAFQEVLTHRPDFDLEYHSRRKSGDVLRKFENYAAAFNQFRMMDRDDKFSNRRPEILYELAKTEELRGNTVVAEALYEEVLRSRNVIPQPLIRAKTYNALAGIHRDIHSNLQMAAAYYDSAAMQNVDPVLLSSDWDAENLASAYNDYVRISNEISRLDTLLVLGELSPQQLDSVLTEMREERIAALNRQEQENTQYLQPSEDLQQGPQISENTPAESGFLNIRDRIMMENARQQFLAIWGDRPLVDHWRRLDVVSVASPEIQEPFANTTNSSNIDSGESPSLYTGLIINRGEIPSTQMERDSLLNDMHTLYYQLGNVFLLNLEMTDSSKVYFNRIVSSEYADDLKPHSYYALADIALQEGNVQEAGYWARRMVEEYPESPLIQNLVNNPMFNIPSGELTEESGNTINELVDTIDSFGLSPFERANRFYEVALQLPDTRQAPYLLYEAAQDYIRSGKGEEEYNRRIEEWNNRIRQWEQTREEFFALQDSANFMLQQTDLTESVREYWQDISERTLDSPNLDEFFPYVGTSWDSARSVLKRIDSLYSDSPIFDRSADLIEELDVPASINENSSENSPVPDTTGHQMIEGEPYLNRQRGAGPRFFRLPAMRIVYTGLA